MARKSKKERFEGAEFRDIRWWRSETPHETIFSVGDRIDRHLSRRRTDYLAHACLYDDSELNSLIADSAAFYSPVPEALTANIVKRQVDTYTAKLSKNRPIPLALTTGGTAGPQRRAKALTKFFEGALDQVGYYATRTLRIRDSALWGTGFAHNYRIGKKLVHERVYPWELSVDPRDAHYGRPTNLYKARFVDRFVLIERFPEFEEEILKAESSAMNAIFAPDDDFGNMVLVREAWHLPSGPDAKDGCHVICISNATLHQGEYVRDYFPFSKLDYTPALVGWFGEGMVKGLAPVQAETNEIGMRLQESAYLTGTYVWVPDGSGIEVDALDNQALSLIRSALKPEWFQPQFASAQLFQYFDKVRTQLPAEITGISGLSTQGQIPPGIESGKAIRTYHQIDSENLIPQGRLDEEDCIATAWQLFDLMEEIHASEKGGFRLRVEKQSGGRAVLEDLDYRKVRLDRESFVLRTFPTSFLATTPEDRWSQVKEMAEAGLFSQDEVLSLLDFPDVQRVMNLRGAPRKIVEKIIETILESDNPIAVYPEPTMNLDLCVAVGTLAYLEAKWLDGADERNLSVLLDFIMNAKALRDGTGGPQAGPQGPDASTDPNAAPPPVNQPGMPPPGPADLYAPPGAPPMPANAVAPAAMPPVPQV